MFCPNCGAKNPEDARFFNQCVTNIKAMQGPYKRDDVDQDNFSRSDTLNSTEEDLDGETEDSIVHCLICKTGSMHPTIHSGTFGFGTRKMLICNNCGASFEIKGQKYKLSEIIDNSQPIWIKYGHQTLTEAEWIRKVKVVFQTRNKRKLTGKQRN
ncbi:MAG: zinc ribbon domain-containing protein [Methanobacterium sp.]|nr:zinc ribbon domain-containing protein [Methanobacterium sp.]